MKLALLSILLALPLAAQDVAGVANSFELARTQQTVIFTITASQGDGSSCTVSKIAGASINLTVACSNAVSSDQNRTIRASGATATSTALLLGDVTCLLVINPTAAAVTMGSVGPAPAKGIAYACTTNIRAGGSVTGQTAIVTGTAQWP